MILTALSEGLGINAATRVFSVGKNSIYRWQNRLSSLQQTLMLYSLCHQFIQLIVEGDELYTKIGKNVPSSESEGWTIVLMDRASRFILTVTDLGEPREIPQEKRKLKGFVTNNHDTVFRSVVQPDFVNLHVFLPQQDFAAQSF